MHRQRGFRVRALVAVVLLCALWAVTATPGERAGATGVRARHSSATSLALTQFTDPQPECEAAISCSDLFGTSVSIDDAGTLAVVGAPHAAPAFSGGTLTEGTAWVFALEDGSWTEVAELAPSGFAPGVQGPEIFGFGTSVTISGDGSTIAVSDSYGGDVPVTSWAAQCHLSTVYVFTQPVGGWSGTVDSVTTLNTPIPQNTFSPYGQPGSSFWACPVAGEGVLGGYLGFQTVWMNFTTDGSELVTSADGDFLYQEPPDGWGASATLNPEVSFLPPSGTLGDGRTAYVTAGGAPIALSADGSTVAVSNVENPVPNAWNEGAPGPYGGAVVSVYDVPDGGWSDAATPPVAAAVITNPDPAGDPVSLSGEPSDSFGDTYTTNFATDDLALNASGTALVTSDTLRCRYAPTTGFGCDGAPNGTDPAGEALLANNQVGGAYVFDLESGTWTLTGSLVSSDSMYDDFEGTSVAISSSGQTVVVGAPMRMLPQTLGYGSGAAFLYTQNPDSTWTESDSLDPVGPNENGDLGWTVALPGDGTTAFVSDPFLGGRYGTSQGWVLRGRALALAPRVVVHDGAVFSLGTAGGPKITAVTNVLIAPGGRFTVTGSGLTGAHFTFDGLAITPVSLTATSATFKVPLTGFTGSLVAEFGTTVLGTGREVGVDAPVFTRFKQASVRPGKTLTIEGRYLTAVNKVMLYPGKTATILSKGPDVIVVRVPKGSKTGIVGLLTPIDVVETTTLKVT